jgi:hypothetical protein
MPDDAPLSTVGPPRRAPWVLALVGLAVFGCLAAATLGASPVRAQACPPYCGTPIITPAWHLHMCDVSYQEQLADNHCMHGPGVVEFPAGTNDVHIIYCHKYTDTVVVRIKDSGGGLQWVNHPDGETYTGDGCESLVFSHRNGIPSAGSPYFTSAYWPEGPFSGVGSGIEWFIGLFIAFDQDVYYGKDATAYITARDPAANEDPTVRETITVHITSASDPTGIDFTLREEASGFPLFKSDLPLRFSTIASDPAKGILKVNNRDLITVSYCPRNCSVPYTDTANWYQIDATITPTPLATWAGPAPTLTPTPPAGRHIEYVAVRPAPADVGYSPQISTNKGRPNHLGYPTLYSGMWTRGTNPHVGMVQFDLVAVPEGVTVVDARLEIVGRESRFTKPGSWAVKLLDRGIDAGWRDATFDLLRTTTVLAQIGPTLTDVDLGVGRKNSLGFTPDQLGFIEDRLGSTRKLSFRVDGPGGDENNLFAWHSGVDVYNRESDPPDPALGPALYLAYEVGPTSTPPGGGSATASATPSRTNTPPAGTPGTVSATPTRTNTPPLGTPGTPTATASRTNTPPGGTPPTAGATPTRTATGGPSSSATPTPTGPTAGPGTASVTPSATRTLPLPTPPTSGTPPGPGTPSVTPPGGTAPATLTPGTPGTGDPPSTTPAPGTGTAPATATGSTVTTPAASPSATATATGPAVQRQVCVVAFVDANGNGAREPEERFLAGANIRLTHQRSGAYISRTTDGANDPDYCWDGLIDGDYSVAAKSWPEGYQATGPVEWLFTIPFAGLPAHYTFGARRGPVPTATATTSPSPRPSDTAAPTQTPAPTGTPTPQPTVVGPAGDLCLTVFHDRDSSHFRDPDEALLADLRISVRADNDGPVREVLSRADGAVCMRLAVGVYYAHAALASGWIATGPEEQAVLVTLGQQQTVAFGQRPLRSPGRAFLPFAARPRPGTPTPSRSGH